VIAVAYFSVVLLVFCAYAALVERAAKKRMERRGVREDA
jgi:hypothetical protein